MNEIVARHYDELGAEKVNELFGDDHTHTNPAGAEINAASVIAGLKGLRHCSLRDYLSANAARIESFPAGISNPK